MSRLPFVAGNWKMNKTAAEAVGLREGAGARACPTGVEVALCVPFTALAEAVHAADGAPHRGVAQNCTESRPGAFTGEVSAPMLVDAGADGVILGHSERRQYLRRDRRGAAAKLLAALEAGLRVILSVGETLNRSARRARREVVLRRQLEAAIGGIAAGQAAATHDRLRAGVGHRHRPHGHARAGAGGPRVHPRRLRELHGDQAADAVRIQYGGS